MISNTENQNVGKRKRFPTRVTVIMGLLAALTMGILSAFTVYSHFKYRESQKRLFTEKWGAIADKISKEASKSLNDTGLVDDEFATFLYWIPAISRDIVSIRLVDINNNPIYSAGGTDDSDSLLAFCTAKALGGKNQIIIPDNSEIINAIIAVPVVKEGTVRAALILTVDDSPVKIGSGSAQIGFILSATVMFLLWTIISVNYFKRLEKKHDLEKSFLSLEAGVAAFGSKQARTQKIIDGCLKEIVSVFDFREGTVYIKDIISGEIKARGYYGRKTAQPRQRRGEEFEPADPRLQAFGDNRVVIYESVSRKIITREIAEKSIADLCIALPLTHNSESFGILNVSLRRKNPLNAQILNALSRVAGIFAITIQKSIEYGLNIKLAENLRQVLEILDAFYSSDQVYSALNQVSKKLASLPGVVFCRILRLDESRQLSTIAETFKGEGDATRQFQDSTSLDELPIHKIALMSGQSQVLQPDEIDRLSLNKNNLYRSKMQDCTIQVTPLQREGSQLGCIVVGTVTDGDYSEEKKEFIENVAHFLSLSLENLMRYTDMKKSFGLLQADREQKTRLARLESMGDLAGGIAGNLDMIFNSLNITGEKLSHVSNVPFLDEIVDTIKDTVNQYHRIIGRFKEFSDVKFSDKLHQLELALIIKNSEARLREESASWPLKLDGIRIVTLNAGSGQIFGNEEKLYQVVSIIVYNSVEAMPGGGDIIIETSVNQKMALVEISDQGTGMTKDEIKRAFEPFFTTKDGVGRGMGLAIAHRIVTLHNGAIEISSELGIGTKVTIMIPLVDPEQTALYSTKKKSTGGMPLTL